MASEHSAHEINGPIAGRDRNSAITYRNAISGNPQQILQGAHLPAAAMAPKAQPGQIHCHSIVLEDLRKS
jgi:hypothetical protein